MVLELFIFFLGLTIGSFLNVCIYRLPQGQSVIFPASHCQQCNHRLGAIDLIPIVSYLLSQGHCRYCGSSYSWRYVVVELVTGLLYVWCYAVFGYSLFLVKTLIFTSFLIVITYIDYDHQLILDKVLLWLAGAGVIIEVILSSVDVVSMLTGALLGGGLLLVIAIASKGGMGGGDVKFAAALGLWFGPALTLLVLFLSFIFGGFFAIGVLLLRRKGRKDYIPFGPFIAAGAFIALLYGRDIIAWYWALL